MESARPTNQPTADLADRQWAVLSLLAQGFTNKEIARQLALSKNIVDKMLSNGPSHYAIYPKIGVTNAKGAVAWCLRQAQTGTEVLESPAAARRVPEAAVSAPSGSPPLLYLTILVTIYACLILLTFMPIWLRPVPDSQDNIWANTLAIIPALAGLYGLHRTSGAGASLSAGERRAWRVFSAGLVCWAGGAAISALYSVQTGSTAPYPSWADIGYFPQTLCQTIAFALWWRASYRRGAQRAWLWPLIALLLTPPYLTLQYMVREPRPDLIAQVFQYGLDLCYALGDSISLAMAICLILPAAMRHCEAPMRRTMRILAAAMALMFLSGLTFMITSYLPDGHWLKFSNGNVIDLCFTTAFLLMGLAIGHIPRRGPDDRRQPAASIN